MEKIIINNKDKLFFISENNNLDGEIIYPRIPQRLMITENTVEKRICCVKNKIYGALKSIPLSLKKYTVYEL